jgi:DNA-binding NtrC family response regulator
MVDDELALLNSLQRRLQLRGFDVIAAGGGEEALEAARRHHVDVAVIDVKMPGMGGKELLLALKKEYPAMGIIMVTGHGSFSFKEEEVTGMIHCCMAKPCDIHKLQEAITAAAAKSG